MKRMVQNFGTNLSDGWYTSRINPNNYREEVNPEIGNRTLKSLYIFNSK